jgi:hypothetical protein
MGRIAIPEMVRAGYRLPIWPTYFLPPVGFLLAAMMTLLRAVQSARELTRGTAGA